MANDKKNTLLEEGTVRRFMKLAEIGPLSNSFLDGYHTLEEQEPPGMEEEDDKLDLELDLDAEEGEIDGVESEEEAFGAGMEVGSEEGGAEEIIMAMASKLKDVAEEFGVEVELEGDVETVELDAPDMDAELDMDPSAELDMGTEEPPEELDVDVIDEEHLVNEVARRVTKRLLTKKSK
jgi:hypothetical protein